MRNVKIQQDGVVMIITAKQEDKSFEFTPSTTSYGLHEVDKLELLTQGLTKYQIEQVDGYLKRKSK